MAIVAPWSGALRYMMPITSALTLINTFIIFVLAVITVADIHFTAATFPDPNTGATYLNSNHMLVTAQLIFFYCTTPSIMLIETAASNYCLWTDKLHPIYAVISSITVTVVWIIQTTFWGICIDNSPSQTPAFCPAALQSKVYRIYAYTHVVYIGVMVFAVPTLFILYVCSSSSCTPHAEEIWTADISGLSYIVYFSCAIKGWMNDRKFSRETASQSQSQAEIQPAMPGKRTWYASNKPQTVSPLNSRTPSYTSVPQRDSDVESLPSYHTREGGGRSTRSSSLYKDSKFQREKDAGWEEMSISTTSHRSSL